MEDQNEWRIALYYCYTPIPDIDDHVAFQKDICVSNGLFGRIRVSHEGVNGVLSGRVSQLKYYEARLRKDLLRLRQLQQEENQESSTANSEKFELDIKYCHLRLDLPLEQQLFDSLSVKATREVVSLYEPPPINQRRSKRNSRRRGRNRQRREQQLSSSRSEETSCVNEAELGKFQPSPHLSPQEWNDKLQSLGDDAILLDARNVYESRVGHFAAEGVPTLLTNTRKYSSLPSVLESSVSELAGKHVFMYCTGGVRCERASVCLQELADSDKWKDYPKPKGIYQLNGGIQRYLEHYGSMNRSSKPECLYKGKNFVFDPRRTDPMVGGTSPGRCLLCQCPHDDYDNGHAPSENREARCCRCRVLVLVCNECRDRVRSCGEEHDKPELLCGGQECIDEGNSANQAQIVHEQQT